jgi:hypothetical protein
MTMRVRASDPTENRGQNNLPIPDEDIDWTGEWVFRVTMWLTIGTILSALLALVVHLAGWR